MSLDDRQEYSILIGRSALPLCKKIKQKNWRHLVEIAECILVIFDLTILSLVILHIGDTDMLIVIGVFNRLCTPSTALYQLLEAYSSMEQTT